MISEDPKDYTEHRELAMRLLNEEIRDNYGEPFNVKEENFSFIHMHIEGPQVMVMETLHLGPREVDVIAVVGFYIPHDGQCTVSVNHVDGIRTLDNADLMFGGS